MYKTRIQVNRHRNTGEIIGTLSDNVGKFVSMTQARLTIVAMSRKIHKRNRYEKRE